MRPPSPKRTPRNCSVCGAEFAPLSYLHRSCGAPDCRRAVKSTKKPIALREPFVVVTGAIACFDCQHSRPQPEATYGVECSIGRWLVCKPANNGAKPYAPKVVDNPEP